MSNVDKVVHWVHFTRQAVLSGVLITSSPASASLVEESGESKWLHGNGARAGFRVPGVLDAQEVVGKGGESRGDSVGGSEEVGCGSTVGGIISDEDWVLVADVAVPGVS